ncbi:hypothetical protein [Rubritalea squalenifaciens]|uniref:hypothetical protein n=1 Tax=Rubritalea squalenifaciens TaxID=407226 RepID=UPI001160CC1E|nr:hypothetical protein [Rubritalea squalenifaciens]
MSPVSKSICGFLLFFCSFLLVSCEQQKSRDVDIKAKKESDPIESATNLSSNDPEPELVEFDGFINYGIPIDTQSNEDLDIPEGIVITESRIEMPVFTAEQLEKYRKSNTQRPKQAEQDAAPKP